MDERRERSLSRTILAMASVTLAVLMLAACGVGGDDDDPTETTEALEDATIESTSAPTDLTTESSPSLVATPAPGASTAGLPPSTPGGATPTPAIVVSAPPLTIPDASPPAAATPDTADLAAALETITGDAAQGDGTSGGASDGADATPADSAASTTVASCDVASLPPFEGEQASQTTTSDVNLRAGPGTDCDPLGEPIAAGVTVEVVSAPVQREGDEFTWVAVTIDGTQGWMATDFLEPAAE